MIRAFMAAFLASGSWSAILKALKDYLMGLK